MNRVILIGNVGKDVASRDAGGTKQASFTMATTDRWKDKDGVKQEKTEWHNIVCFGRTAEIAESYVAKGDKLAIDGKLQTRKWTDKEGKERYTTEVLVDKLELLGGPKAREEAKPAPVVPKRSAAVESFADFDDDIPL